MTKLFKWLGGTATAALVGTLMFGAAGTFSAGEAEAQSPPSPPARFGGEVTIDGEQAPAGTPVQAQVDGNNCGTTSVAGDGTYVVDVEANEPTEAPGCGTEGATVTFLVDGEMANESGEWIDFDFNRLDLSLQTEEEPTATPTEETEDPTATPTEDNGDDDNGDDDNGDDDNGDDDAEPTATPRGPDTGTGLSSTTGNGAGAGAMLTIVALGAAGFGAAGFAAARRRQ